MDQRPPTTFPAKNFVVFLVLAFSVLLLNVWVMSKLNPPPPPREQAAQDDDRPAGGDGDADGDAVGPGDGAEDGDQRDGPADSDQPDGDSPVDQTPDQDGVGEDDGAEDDGTEDDGEEDGAAVPPPADIPSKWVTLGSVSPHSPYRMLVTLSSRGAALVRAELSSRRYRDLEYEGGYMGHLVVDERAVERGCPVQVVGDGTPAEEAGIEVGDLITAVNDQPIDSPGALRDVLRQIDPGTSVQVALRRGGEELTLPVELARRPMEVVRPEGKDPWSMLFTFHQIDDRVLPDKTELYDRMREALGSVPTQGEDDDAIYFPDQVPPYVTHELPGLDLRGGNWELIDGHTAEQAAFRRVLPRWNLEVVKTYRLARLPNDDPNELSAKAYHLLLEVEIRNTGDDSRRLAYQLDGPTGLPTEGWWYAYKIGREGLTGGSVGLRDVIVYENDGPLRQIGCPVIAQNQFGNPVDEQLVSYLGVDAQYFSAVMIPQKERVDELWFEQWEPLRVGAIPRDDIWKLTNTSCRVVSLTHELAGGDSLKHEYEVFIGPKQPDLLAQYGLGEVVYYGWFGFIARPMLGILHFFHDWVVFNYGLAIIMLTVLVRGAMFPLSRKQVQGAQKMQELQPELKKLQEKYKKDPEARTKAQQELFRRHNYNPLSGCLVLFVQLPIFIALYRSLIVDVELRQAPLISSSIRWCSNLAAPDMLFDWSGFMPEWVNNGQGMLGLGPYFNLLPILTIFLFIAQQKMFMPPATDDQTRMQQKMMQFMMVFMGIIFFKVASGLCIYFIASSLWGVAERKMLPRTQPAKASTPAAGETSKVKRDRPRPQPRDSRVEDDGSARKRKGKKRGRR